jgi:ribose 5-phosphate isomerase B
MKNPMSIAIGCDHAGFSLKGPIAEFLKQQNYLVEDCGSYDPNPIDFPDIARAVCVHVLNGKVQRGIMVCGTGVGACIAANKIPGIRAAVCHDIHSAHQCVEHDDVNVACVGAWIVGSSVARECLQAFLEATFSTSEEFRRRVEKLAEMDRQTASSAIQH